MNFGTIISFIVQKKGNMLKNMDQ